MTTFSEPLEQVEIPGRSPSPALEEIEIVAEELEHHCRALGRDFLASEGQVPDWLLDDLCLALVCQGVLTE